MNEKVIKFDEKKYPFLSKYADFMLPPTRPVLGRERESRLLLASLNRAELSNAFLLGDAGSGKTMLVQGVSVIDSCRIYVEVDLAKMAASEKGEDGATQMASRVKGLFDDALKYKKDIEKRNKELPEEEQISSELVLFIDEFHLLVQLSAAAAQAIKPILAESGRLGIKIIGATTFAEFHEFVEQDQALMQRLQRINIREPRKEVVIAILKSIAKAHGVYDDIYDKRLYEMIYEYSNRYVPADSQPRKSILMLDSMIGWYRTYPGEFKMDRHLLADVILDSTGVQVTFEIDGASIKSQLDNRVYSQTYATSAIEQRLQIAVADLHDKTRPISSFLFTGPTGVGKALRDDELIPVYDRNKKVLYKRNGDLRVGDFVYNKEGKPVEVTGVYPQGEQKMYKVILWDGREIICNDNHLWTWSYPYYDGTLDWKTTSLRDLINRGVKKYHPETDKQVPAYVIPMNKPVDRQAYSSDEEPYIIGLTIARHSGCGVIPNDDVKDFDGVADVLGIELKENDAYIPVKYKGGSIEQRWSLIQGFFDMCGFIEDNKDKTLKFKSKYDRLLDDVREVLFSLGISSIKEEDTLTIRVFDKDKYKFFRVSHNKKIADEIKNNREYVKGLTVEGKPVEKHLDSIGIKDIVELDSKEKMTCITVDDEDHLYLAGENYIVTHNTEMVKGMAELLFGEERAMIRFDMSEYALENSLDRFREELTNRVWNQSHAVVLFDEVEKANPAITRLMLQVLDDGRLTNAQGREVSFLNVYIVLTTNAGSEIYESIAHYSQDDEGAGGMAEYQKVIRRSLIANESFAPEIINRMNAIVPFQPLTNKTYERIILNKLRGIQEEVYRVHGIEVMIHPDVVGYLVYESFDIDTTSGGARGLVARMDSEVVSPLARYVNKHPDVKNVGIHIKGEMAYRNKNIRQSDAYVEVGTIDRKRARRQ